MLLFMCALILMWKVIRIGVEDVVEEDAEQ